MANEWDDEDDEFEPQGNDLLKQLRSQIKKLEKANAAKDEELATLRTSTRTRTIKDVLDKRGINPKIAVFMNDVEPSEDAINKWLDDYGDVFGIEKESEPDPQQAAQAAAQQQMAKVQNASAPFVVPPDISEGLATATSKEELDRLIFGQVVGDF